MRLNALNKIVFPDDDGPSNATHTGTPGSRFAATTEQTIRNAETSGTW